MANEFLNIDSYFQGKLSAQEKEAFENNLANDPSLAEDVVFYAHVKCIQRDQILKERHAEWTTQSGNKVVGINFKLISAGIAAILLMIIGVWHFTGSDIQQRTNAYIENDLDQLTNTMGATDDSLKLGKDLYNQKKYTEARVVFDKLINKSPEAIEFAGLSAIKMNDDEEAIKYFKKIEQNTELINNKGKFYLALVKIKQGKIEEGERLLNEVIDQNLGGKNDAKKILE
ncbi:MAG: tetratricopeptide repeat protein [Emticicia sp.]|uniref:tetratricopeptide repeat protein n=1 Tax=Emticicia sp. TaxID=1930953 RepID=UPI003BA6E6A9